MIKTATCGRCNTAGPILYREGQGPDRNGYGSVWDTDPSEDVEVCHDCAASDLDESVARTTALRTIKVMEALAARLIRGGHRKKKRDRMIESVRAKLVRGGREELETWERRLVGS